MGQRLNLPANTPPVAHTSFSLQPPATHLSPNIPALNCEQTYKANPKVFLPLERHPGHRNLNLWGPYHLLASQKGQLLPQTGDMIVASLPDGCAA